MWLYELQLPVGQAYSASCSLQLRTDFHLILMNLVLSDLGVAAFGIPTDITATLREGHTLSHYSI
jgi:hypothetical protein